jgi:hypothetical protein
MTNAALEALVAAETGRPVDLRVCAMAAAIAARHPSARAVLYYGSTLREAQLDGLMLDFYLIVRDYRAAFVQHWLAAANRLIPPNVFPFEHDGLISKYAVLSGEDFARLSSSRTRNVSVWARFAQPSRIAWLADEAARGGIVRSIAQCAPALLAAARPCVPDRLASLDLWRTAFALTYRAELRAERTGRAGSVVDAEPDRYRAFTLPALAAAGIPAQVQDDTLLFDRPLTDGARTAGLRDWAQRRRAGKALTLLRLVKASATYAGGLDYLAWKIGRHSGHPVTIRPWQRRWPILGAITLLPRLIAKGAVR